MMHEWYGFNVTLLLVVLPGTHTARRRLKTKKKLVLVAISGPKGVALGSPTRWA